MKTLKDVPIGGVATVLRLHGEGAVRRRIMDIYRLPDRLDLRRLVRVGVGGDHGRARLRADRFARAARRSGLHALLPQI